MNRNKIYDITEMLSDDIYYLLDSIYIENLDNDVEENIFQDDDFIHPNYIASLFKDNLVTILLKMKALIKMLHMAYQNNSNCYKTNQNNVRRMYYSTTSAI